MLKIDYLRELLVVAIALSAITCALIQKTKKQFKSSKYLPVYSFFVNIIVGITFCFSFTNITFPISIWVGLFSFIGADSIYKSLEGKLASYTDIVNRNKITISKDKIINKEDNSNGKAPISK